MRTPHYKFGVIGIVLIFAMGFAVFRWWQGPLVTAITVESMPLVQTVVATGKVVSVSRAQIGSEITGVVLDRLVQEGDRVSRGDLLLVLKSDELSSQVRQAEAELNELKSRTHPETKNDLANAKAQLDQARREANRRRNAEKGVLSSEEIEQAIQAETVALNNFETARLKAEAASPGQVEEIKLTERLTTLKAQLAKTKIRSEVTGIILTRDVEPGDLVQPGRTLFNIALDGRTEIRVQLDERNLPQLALSQKAQVIADAYPDKPFPAQINFIAPSIDSERGTVEVRLSVDAAPEFLRQDMTVSVNIETGKREKSIVVPNDTLSNIHMNKAMVSVVRHGKLQHQAVSLGLRGLGMTEITSGLKTGDHVISDATNHLTDGTRVRLNLQTLPYINQSNEINFNKSTVQSD